MVDAAEVGFDLIAMGLIPHGLPRHDSGVGWVESFDRAQDKLRDTHRSFAVGIGALRLHPPYELFEARLLHYPAACGGVLKLVWADQRVRPPEGQPQGLPLQLRNAP